MLFVPLFVSYLLAAPLGAFASPLVESRANGIDQTTYDNLVRYTKYSSAVYQWLCPKPLGNKLIDQFDVSGTQGFVARDDSRKEIVIAFRGTGELKDAFVDLQIIMKPLQITGLTTSVSGAQAHTGFQYAYNVAASTVLKTVKAQAAAYPTYTIVVTGHSLGGAVAALAAVSIKAAVNPKAGLKLYTYGQPRTGNAAFATYVENTIGVNNIFRAVHTYDGVPTILFKELGYRHFATEYWQYQESPSPANVKKCSGGDDPSCSDSIPSTFINPAHIVYFGQAMALNPLLCI
ncbi:putative feruloyl esterase A [Psilocybe cubensis]|uniref:Feruloyl esterase A n=2 Tax=Psilocybe cubensis TaxID=181762 RepID=A0ACB8HBA7_PSICU|nr:putative feruloyl esterase A [Psilocybe cubensis]KAH9484947.1 putative feruloyl esterase A [Psilocybe cubensis]